MTCTWHVVCLCPMCRHSQCSGGDNTLAERFLHFTHSQDRGIIMCTGVCLHVYVHVRLHAYVHVRLHAYVHVRLHAYVHVRLHAYVHVRLHAYVHVRISVCYMCNIAPLPSPPPSPDPQDEHHSGRARPSLGEHETPSSEVDIGTPGEKLAHCSTRNS